ncbi:MAG TPA: hypothetical protein VGQ59_09095 [Cyclobacteriaceae bacterium]|jgi:hypothetical protein|nr:hypothetical protein [Cyclobacteriaceae bacterium]
MKEVIHCLEFITGILGIFLSIYPALKLFRQINVLDELRPLLTPEEQKETTKEDLYKDLAARINDQIKYSRKTTNDEFRRDKKLWLLWIKIGALLSAISLVLSYISTTSLFC